jgi:2-isopropylmalate synthase
MTNTIFQNNSFQGEILPDPADGQGPIHLISARIVADKNQTIELEIELTEFGLRRLLRGSGRTQVVAFVAALKRGGIDVSLPEREVHDWDGATGTVTSYVSCSIGDRTLWGAGVARERGEASMRAVVSVCNRATVSARLEPWISSQTSSSTASGGQAPRVTASR